VDYKLCLNMLSGATSRRCSASRCAGEATDPVCSTRVDSAGGRQTASR
jgi:hypothetical protein